MPQEWSARKLTRFNPHSSFRPSATVHGILFTVRVGVSILTRAFARVQHDITGRTGRASRVSILTRAFARVQLGLTCQGAPQRTFQSSLELSPECNGGTPAHTCKGRRFLVSILTRAFARVQHRESARRDAIAKRFNPHSSFRPSATRMLCCYSAQSGCCFNPHSSFRPSATGALPPSPTMPLWFQSSLELSPECNCTARR